MGWLLKIGAAVALGVMIYLWLRRLLASTSSMPPAEARALLGVRDDATLAEIREAHRRLIARVHPDTGGSAELATKVNSARDVLVAQLNRTPPRAS
jgi:DnaJ homolog subfamily C member 19